MAMPDPNFWELFFWEFGQNLRIADVYGEAHSLGAEVGDVKHDLKSLSQRIDRIALLLLAMASLMREKSGLTHEELMERLRHFDLLDGKLDGKFEPTGRCPACGAMMMLRKGKCDFCGHGPPETMHQTLLEELP